MHLVDSLRGVRNRVNRYKNSFTTKTNMEEEGQLRAGRLPSPVLQPVFKLWPWVARQPLLQLLTKRLPRNLYPGTPPPDDVCSLLAGNRWIDVDTSEVVADGVLDHPREAPARLEPSLVPG